MRAIFILPILIVFILLSGCTTIEVAKEINKATNSFKTSIQNIISDEEGLKEEIPLENNKEEEKKELKETISLEQKTIVIEKKKEEKVVLKQNKIATINFIGKTLKELIENLGEPKLLREDGKTITARFDTKSCRIFVYFNRSIEKSGVKHYELRNPFGKLIEKQIDIKKCFEEIKLT